MALVIKKSHELIHPDNLKLKILVYGLSGCGKTTWMTTAEDLGVGASETGHGRGMLGNAARDFELVELNSYEDFDSFCSGAVFSDKSTIGLDSLSWVSKTIIKDKALSIPRAKGESQKRVMGVPEIDDYGTMGELTRKLIAKLVNGPQNLIVTAGLRIDRPDDNNPTGDTLVGPDLPGQMFLGSTAMFDIVLAMRTRSVLRNPKDAKSRYTEYYYITNSPGGGVLAKNRLSVSSKGLSFLPQEVTVNLETGEGTFPWMLARAREAYEKWLAEQQIPIVVKA